MRFIGTQFNMHTSMRALRTPLKSLLRTHYTVESAASINLWNGSLDTSLGLVSWGALVSLGMSGGPLLPAQHGAGLQIQWNLS